MFYHNPLKFPVLDFSTGLGIKHFNTKFTKDTMRPCCAGGLCIANRSAHRGGHGVGALRPATRRPAFSAVCTLHSAFPTLESFCKKNFRKNGETGY